MLTLEQLTLNGAVTLLTYLQHNRLEDEATGAIAIAACLSDMLRQLESLYPGIASHYGGHPVYAEGVIENPSIDYQFLDDDCYSGFKPASVS